MEDQHRQLDDLLDQWEDAKEQGIDLPLESLCGGDTSLVEAMRRRIEAFSSIERRFTSMKTVPDVKALLEQRPDGQTQNEILPPLHSSHCYSDISFHRAGRIGTVYRAFDRSFQRWVAIKTIKASRASNPFDLDKFRMEAEIASRLEHPAIIPVYCSGDLPDGRPFYAMRFVRGSSLDDGIRELHATYPNVSVPECRLPFDHLLRCFVIACRGLAYAHYRGIIHRDIKPDHILVGRYGETLLVDWGLAKPIGREGLFKNEFEETLVPHAYMPTPDGEAVVVGTPMYMSPEQLLGRSVSPSSDIYSLGITLFKLLTGTVPFEASDYFALRENVLKGDCKRPSLCKPELNPLLDVIVGKAMHPSRDRRYLTAGHLAADIERYLAGEPTEASLESEARWPAPSIQRKSWWPFKVATTRDK